MKITILYEDNYLIVCEKPAGVPSQGDKSQAVDMISHLKIYLREKEPEKGIPYVAAVHRLDRPVGGIMVYAKTKEAAAELSRQIQKGQVNKEYLAVICGDFSSEIGKEPQYLCDYLKKDGKTNLSVVSKQSDSQAKKAELAYQVLEVTEEAEAGALSLLNVRLFTGRHHQIRVQMAHHLAGIWGDNKYNGQSPRMAGSLSDGTASMAGRAGGKSRNFREVALYSWRLSFLHPKTKKPMKFEKCPEKYPFSEFKRIEENRA